MRVLNGMAQSKTKINTQKRHKRLIVSICKKKAKKMTVEISKLTSHRLILPPSNSYTFQREARERM